MLKAIDLFSGCGGLTVGLKSAGFEVAGAIELNSGAAQIYRDNHPEVLLWEKDIQDVSVAAVKRRCRIRVGELDLLAGCPPCQGFSSVRTLNGSRDIVDARNDLIVEFQRFVVGLKPNAVMLENVPGLASDQRLDAFVNCLEALGYSVGYRVLNAADYGVPQRRWRLILLAGLNGVIKFAPQSKVRRTVRDAISDLPAAGTSGDSAHDQPEKRQERIRRLISMIPKDGGSRRDLPPEFELECHRKCDGFNDVYGRMAWDSVAPTLTTGCFNPSKGRFLHPAENRSITMREAAMLQTFPRDYRFPDSLGRSVLATHIGNALPPEFVARHARAVRRHLEENSQIARQG